MRAFRKIVHKLAPSWLTDDDGGKVLYSLHLMLDSWLERGRLGVLARFPEYAPDDAIAALSRDRKIIRGLNEPVSSFAVRLRKWLDTHRIAGNPFALLEQIRAYLQADVLVRTVDQNGNWYWIDPDGSYHTQLKAGQWNWDSATTTNWSRFWVIIYGRTLWTTAKYGDGSKYSAAHVWGLSATPDQIAGLRSVVRQWKPAHAKCEQIIVAMDDSIFQPGTTLDGNWGRYSSRTDPRTPARSTLARYITP